MALQLPGDTAWRPSYRYRRLTAAPVRRGGGVVFAVSASLLNTARSNMASYRQRTILSRNVFRHRAAAMMHQMNHRSGEHARPSWTRCVLPTPNFTLSTTRNQQCATSTLASNLVGSATSDRHRDLVAPPEREGPGRIVEPPDRRAGRLEGSVLQCIEQLSGAGRRGRGDRRLLSCGRRNGGSRTLFVSSLAPWDGLLPCGIGQVVARAAMSPQLKASPA